MFLKLAFTFSIIMIVITTSYSIISDGLEDVKKD